MRRCDQRCWTGIAVRVASVCVTVDCVAACVAVLPVCLQLRTAVHTVNKVLLGIFDYSDSVSCRGWHRRMNEPFMTA